MSKKPVLDEEEVVELNQELVDDFNNALEQTINDVCEKHNGIDPRLELLFTLGSITSQVAMDTGLDRDDFIRFMVDIFGDLEEVITDEDESLKDKFNLN